MIQVERSQSNIFNNSIENIFSRGESTILDEQIEIYKSHSNILSVIDKLKLNIEVDEIPYSESSLNNSVNDIKINLPFNKKYYRFSIEVNDLNSFNIIDHENNMEFNNLEWDFLHDLPFGNIDISFNDQLSQGDVFEITYSNLSNTVKNLQENLSINPVTSQRSFTTQNTLLKLSIISEFPNSAMKIINQSNKTFVDNSLSNNKAEAEQSLIFLKAQLTELKQRLNQKESLLNKIKSENSSIDMEFEIQVLIERSISIESAIKELDLDIIKSNNLYSKENPIYISLIDQRNSLLQEKQQIDTNIKELPANQQIFVDLMRELQADQILYEELLQKELELALVMASTIGDVKILDSAYVAEKVGPQKFISLLIAVFASLVISGLFIFVKDAAFSRITSPEDVDNLLEGSQSIGIVTNISDGRIDANNNEISTLASNILLLKDSDSTDRIIFEFISGAPGAGKSTISQLVAKEISKRNKKTLLIDCDYKKGTVNSSAKSIIKDPIKFFESDDIYKKCKVSEFLWEIPSPRKRNFNSLNIFDSLSFKKFLQDRRDEFDVIIIDSPAFLVLPDALLLSKYVDEIIPVIRHQHSTQNNVVEVKKKLATMGKSSNYYIYNDFLANKFLNYYGYYGYYGYYQSQYEEYKSYYEPDDGEKDV